MTIHVRVQGHRSVTQVVVIIQQGKPVIAVGGIHKEYRERVTARHRDARCRVVHIARWNVGQARVLDRNHSIPTVPKVSCIRL